MTEVVSKYGQMDPARERQEINDAFKQGGGGAPGPTGPAGPAGAAGAPGDTGPIGPAGADATLAVSGDGANFVSGVRRVVLVGSSLSPPSGASDLVTVTPVTFPSTELTGVLDHQVGPYAIQIFSGDSEELGLNGLSLVQGYSVSIGAYPFQQQKYGGSFS